MLSYILPRGAEQLILRGGNTYQGEVVFDFVRKHFDDN